MSALRRSALALALVLAGCGEPTNGPIASAAPSASGAPSAAPLDAVLALREAEQRRASAQVTQEAHAHRRVEVRRAAARALARIGGEGARAGLLRALADEDADTIVWAAYGLGYDCAAAREENVAALAARALALPKEAPFDDAFAAIARAVGRCGAKASEPTLVAWLALPGARGRGAALALGDLASQAKRLREESLVALLAAAQGGVSEPPRGEALFPLSRIDNVPPSVTGRVAEVATQRLAEPGPYRLFAVRALGRARADGLAGLEKVLLAATPGTFTVPERVEAVRAAVRLGDGGVALAERATQALVDVGPALLDGSDDAAVLLASASALEGVKPDAAVLAKLSELAVPAGASERQRRIGALLRCAGARGAAGTRFDDPRLVACDPAKDGWIGKRAVAVVLGRAPWKGPRLARARALLGDPDPRVREAVLELLSGHAELPDAQAVLVAALGATEPGVASTAAEQIAKAPSLASAPQKPKKAPAPGTTAFDPTRSNAPGSPDEEPLPPPEPKVLEALVAALARSQATHDHELGGAVIDALGALGQPALAKHVEPLCASSWPALREHAQKALGLLEGKKRTCAAPPQADELPPESLADELGTVRVVLETDAGELALVLDRALAPVTTARVVSLVEGGTYAGNVIHRVDPSFVVQFGSPAGDGFGGPPERLPLRCETSPRPFEGLGVGLALAGRDTGSSQLFVMRARHPHLDGQYPLVGTAEGPWDRVFEGDVIQKARIAP